jgi:hypothetical protein
VSYQVRFEGKALVQLKGLPLAAFDAIVERVAVLVDEPWDAVVMTRGGDPSIRQTAFGSGSGLLSFRVDDNAELIRIFDIVWVG